MASLYMIICIGQDMLEWIHSCSGRHGRGQNLASPHGRPSDHALLVSQDGVVDHAGDGAHGRPEGRVVLQALHRDPPELQGTIRLTVGSGITKKSSWVTLLSGLESGTLRAPAGGYWSPSFGSMHS